MRTRYILLRISAVLGMLLMIASPSAWAHCDGMDGPVVKAAQKALETGNADPVLIWVQKKDEAELRRTFERALAVRKLSPEAKALADTHLLETVVRLHRAGEGAPYTGLKPAGRDLGPAIPAADKALEEGSVEPVVKLLTSRLEEGIRQRFKETLAKRRFQASDTAAGREYVEAYVSFIHYVEHSYDAAANPAEHNEQAEAQEPHK